MLDTADRAWAEALVGDYFGSTRVVSRGRLHETRELPCLAAYSEGSPVGLSHYRLDDDGGCEVITLIASEPGHGAGTALLGAVADRASVAGCRRVWLVTTNDNSRAQRFYTSRGWVRAAVHPGAVRLARELKPEIPLVGEGGVPIEDEIEFELVLRA